MSATHLQESERRAERATPSAQTNDERDRSCGRVAALLRTHVDMQRTQLAHFWMKCLFEAFLVLTG